MPPEDPSPASRLCTFARSVGEVFAFLGTGLWAVVQFCLGRWPEFPRPRRKASGHEPDLAEKVGPYPSQD